MNTSLRQDAIDRHNRQNLTHTVLLLGALGLILAVVGLLVWGPMGLIYSVVIGGVLMLVGRRMAPKMVLRMYRAQPLSRRGSPQLYAMVDELSKRAGLSKVPQLYYVPSPVMNAFTTGMQDNAIVCVFDGLLKGLNAGEIAGVLAHEISHIKNNDTLVLGMADMVSRITGFMPILAIVMVVGNLGGAAIPWLTVVVMFFAPQLTAALQSMLSRSREFDADLDAATLTRDPRSLASALGKIQQYHGKMLERVMLPGRKEPAPSHSRSHPPTRQRIERLLALEAPADNPDTMLAFAGLAKPTDSLWEQAAKPLGHPAVRSAPRWRMSGLWH